MDSTIEPNRIIALSATAFLVVRPLYQSLSTRFLIYIASIHTYHIQPMASSTIAFSRPDFLGHFQDPSMLLYPRRPQPLQNQSITRPVWRCCPNSSQRAVICRPHQLEGHLLAQRIPPPLRIPQPPPKHKRRQLRLRQYPRPHSLPPNFCSCLL